MLAERSCYALLHAVAEAAALRPQDGKTPLDLAKDEVPRVVLRAAPTDAAATTAALRVAAAERAAVAAEDRAKAAEAALDVARQDAAAAAAAVPADVAALLDQLSMSQHGVALVSQLGVASVADLRLMSEADLEKEVPALKLAERRRLHSAIALATAPAAAAAPAAAGPDPADVMISYRVPETGDGGDRSVFALQEALQKRGYSVFVGETAIQGASSWPSSIQKGVENCKAFVMLCSETYGDADKSPWTKRELELADYLKKPLLPVWHSGPYPPRPVAIYLGGTQRIPSGIFRNGYANADISHERVAEELAAALARLGVPVAAV